MKLVLYSLNFTNAISNALNELVGKNSKEIKIALIENAADLDQEAPTGWVEEIRTTMIEKGYQIKLVDLRRWLDTKVGLETEFEEIDAIWIGGGNGYYLRWILKETGTDTLIRELLKKGVVYSGWSAGACIAGPTLKYAETMDDPSQVPELIYDGLNLIDKVIIPHTDNEMFAERAWAWSEQLNKEGFKTVPLKDSQALVINGALERILDSSESE